jgi:glucose-6-phosphate 1-epimerase
VRVRSRCSVVVWSPWTSMEACYKEFVAVENAAVGKPVVVAPGASWSGSMELTA